MTRWWEGGDGDGATPISADDREYLIPKHITLRRELNDEEARGVVAAVTWASARRRSEKTALNARFIQVLHRRMFGDVWTWAGQYRTRETSIGVDPHTIAVELHKLVDDARYWVEHKTYRADELAVIFHHRLVQIHPFANGNGRLCRLMADVLAAALGSSPFTWGRESLGGEARTRYLQAVREADKGDYDPLFALARLP